MIDFDKRIHTWKQLKNWLNYESKRYGKRNFWFPLICITEQDYIRKHQILLRKTEYFINTKKKMRAALFLVKLKRFQNKIGIHIPANTCERGLKIIHLGPVLISENAKVGENCVFHLNTGVVAGGNNDEAPEIGKDVIIGFGSCIVGKTVIADGIAIGANSLVNKSFLDPHITIAGSPAHKISDYGSEKWHHNSI